MCNYVTAFSFDSYSGNQRPSFAFLSNLSLSSFAAGGIFEGDDDNRGSGR